MSILDTQVLDVSDNFETPIQKFFKNESLFITGGTGFLGKCLIEKLLRSCSAIKNIYILVRSKRGKNIQCRVEDLLNDAIFNKIKQQSPKLLQKIIPVEGDVSELNLGLSNFDRAMLENNASIVFHVAATVRFDEKLKLSLAINLNGTIGVLNICKSMQHLKAVVHVSTAYANCHLKEIDEKFNDFPIHYEDLELMLDKMNDNEVEKLTSKVIGRWPNTYTFTKAMAESYIQENSRGLPIAVFRPAIIVGTDKEPIPGWIDNLYGPTGIYVSALMGVLGSMHMNGDNVANLVPVDMCVNCLIAASFEAATSGPVSNPGEVAIYNYVSSVEKPITWNEYAAINIVFARKYPSANALLDLNFNLTPIYIVHRFKMFAFHFCPALVADMALMCLGRKPRFLKLYKKIDNFQNVYSYFCNTNFAFSNKNVRKLWKKLDKSDQKMFDFDMNKLNWLEFFKNSAVGIRSFILKEDMSSLEKAYLRKNRLYIAGTMLKIIFFYFSIYTILTSFRRLSMIILKNVLSYMG